MPLRVLVLLIVYSLFSSPAVHSAQQEFFPFVGEVSSKKVNVRAGQSANFENLYRLKQGDEVLVLEKSFSWYKIKLPAQTSVFISARYVTLLTENIGEVTANRVNIRARASDSSTVLGQLSNGDKFQVVDEVNDWYKIKPLDDLYGWVSEEYITFKSSDVKAFKDNSFSLKEKFAFLDRKPKETKETETFVIDEDSIGQQALSQIYEVLNESPEDMANTKTTESKTLPQASVSGKSADKDAKIQSNSSGAISVVGYIKPRTDNVTDNIKYYLVVDGKPAYLIKGWHQVVEQFLYYEVQIEGTFENDVQKKYPYPVISISNIQLAL